MKTIASFIIAFAMVFAGLPVNAQETSAGAAAQNEVNVVAITGAQGESSIKQSGHVWSTPTVLRSSFGGANPCLIGQGAGIAGGPIGISISSGKSDPSCTRRNDAAAFNSMGMKGVAIAIMCRPVNKDDPYGNADSFYSITGTVCPGIEQSRYKLADGSLPPYADLSNM